MYNASVVTTAHGPVRGRVVAGIHTFRGIRYGRDTAPTRFLPPVAPEPWTEVQNAFEFGPTAPQDDPVTGQDRATNPFLVKIGLTDNLPESEDCLFLNVWTPHPDGARRPVMVWVHSGGYAANSGSSPAIDGARLAGRGDVVTVSFNHRLNVLGYSHLTDDPASPFAGSGNVGMLDIVAVLEWVRANIESFGGDPDNVTIFGQSGGAMKVTTLLGMPSARGLFHKAIMQSGAAPRAFSVAEVSAATAELTRRLGLRAGDLEALQRVELTELMTAYGETVAAGIGSFGAVVDGIVVPSDPFVPDASPLSVDVPIIVGDLDTEATLFMLAGGPQLTRLDETGARERLTRVIGAERAEALYEVLQAEHPDAGPFELLARAVSDGVFAANTAIVADAKARQGGAPVWRYRITWRTEVDGGAFLSPHEVDVALTFGNIESAVGLNGGDTNARMLSDILQESWLAFARTGSPVTGSVPDWPAYDASRRVLALAPEPSIVEAPDAAELDLVTGILPERLNWFRAL